MIFLCNLCLASGGESGTVACIPARPIVEYDQQQRSLRPPHCVRAEEAIVSNLQPTPYC